MSIAVSSNFNYVAVGGDEESKVVASNVSERIRRQHEALQTIGNDPHTTFTQLAQDATQNSSTVLTPTHTRQRSTTSGGSGQYPPHHFEKTPQHLHAALNRQESMDRGEYKEPTSPQHKPHARPLCSGWLYMQKNTGKWKRLWCEYVHAELTYRTEETARKPKGIIRVAYCESEYSARTIANHVNAASGGVHIAHTGSGSSILSTSPTKESTLSIATNTATTATTTSSSTSTTIATSSSSSASATITSSPSPAPTAAQRETSGNMAALLAGVLGGNANGGSGFPAAKYDDLYWSYLESQDAQHAFQIHAPGRVYLFRAETEELCTTFVNTIRNELKSVCEPTLWKEKEAAFVEFSPLVREQFILQVNRFNALVKSLSKSGFVEDDLPITSTRKEKSGVLCMETPTDFTKWRDYYFVLFEGALFYYKDSKSTTPTGFITLRFASIQIDPKRLARGEYVLNVKTPLRTVVCRTKHAVALSEWIACLENTLNVQMKRKNGRRTSLTVLQDINKLIADVSSFNSMLQHPEGLAAFKKFVAEERKSSNHLEFYIQSQELNSSSLQPSELSQLATDIFDRFFKPDSKQRLTDLPSNAKADLELKLSSGVPTVSIFDEARKSIFTTLCQDFDDFKKTPEYKSINFESNNKVVTDDKRDVTPFDGSMVPQFLLKVKGKKRSEEVKLSKKQPIFTIGRDKSNSLVIEDSRVSRSHARVEINETHCEFIDLGSSCGSKLNGRPVLRAKLQPGDVIELGQSTLIFTIKKKRRFSLFG